MILHKNQYEYFPLIIPILLIIGMFGFVQTDFFNSNQLLLSKALLFDLLVGIPVLCYFIFLKVQIPLKTLLKVFTVCLFISTLIIPESNFEYITFIKQLVYPILKIWIGYKVIRKLMRLSNEYKIQSTNNEGYALYSSTIKNTFGSKLGEILLMEFSLLYFLFLPRRNKPLAENEFGYSKNKGIVEMVFAFIFMIIIETVVAHILISKWSLIAAIIASYSSFYLVLLFVSILRSREHFPISLEHNILLMKSGYVNRSVVKLDDISHIEFSSKSNIPELMKLSAFKGVASHNIVIHFIKSQSITKVFGIKKEYKSIALFVDNPKDFIDAINARRNTNKSTKRSDRSYNHLPLKY